MLGLNAGFGEFGVHEGDAEGQLRATLDQGPLGSGGGAANVLRQFGARFTQQPRFAGATV
jgi:hypothetical protein